MAKRILVTGGAGYIGSHTVHMLQKKGYRPFVYDSLERGNYRSVPKGVPFLIADLANTSALESTIKQYKPDAVMHFAGYIEAGESMSEWKKYYENNTINGIKLVKAMLKNGVNKLIFSSTAAVYGEPYETPITEDAEKEPTNHYGMSKLIFENYLNSCDGLNSICLRYFNAAGAGYGIGENHEPETHLIPLALKTALGQQDEIKIFGDDYDTPDGTCVRDYVHVLDLAEAHILALDAVEKKSEKYNLGTGKGNSVLEVIETAEKVVGKRIPKKFCERREGDPAVLVASHDKIRKELGWEPKRNLKETIRSAWEWHTKNPKGF